MKFVLPLLNYEFVNFARVYRYAYEYPPPPSPIIMHGMPLSINQLETACEQAGDLMLRGACFVPILWFLESWALGVTFFLAFVIDAHFELITQDIDVPMSLLCVLMLP